MTLRTRELLFSLLVTKIVKISHSKKLIRVDSRDLFYPSSSIGIFMSAFFWSASNLDCSFMNERSTLVDIGLNLWIFFRIFQMKWDEILLRPCAAFLLCLHYNCPWKKMIWNVLDKTFIQNFHVKVKCLWGSEIYCPRTSCIGND